MTKARRNQRNARIYFGILGNYDLVLHHKDTSLKYTNPDRYNEWDIEDLVVMTRAEHTRLHKPATGKSWVLSEDTKKNQSEAALKSYADGRKGSATNKHWFNNSVVETYGFECPVGYNPGRLKSTGNKISESKKLKRYAELTGNCKN